VGCTLEIWFGGRVWVFGSSGSPAGVCGPCVGISGRSEIGEVTVRFGGFVGLGAPAVGCTLAIWFGGRVWVFGSSGLPGSLPLICCIFLTLSVCNFLEMVTCQNGIGGCKMPFLQMDRTQGALFNESFIIALTYLFSFLREVIHFLNHFSKISFHLWFATMIV
jgi:hypothetical protein